MQNENSQSHHVHSKSRSLFKGLEVTVLSMGDSEEYFSSPQAFAIVNDLSQLISEPTRVPDR